MPKEPTNEADAKSSNDDKAPAAAETDGNQHAPPTVGRQQPALEGNALRARNTYAAISADLAVR